VAVQALEEPDEMAFVGVGGAQPRDGKVRVDARDVLDRLRLEVENGCVLARFEI